MIELRSAPSGDRPATPPTVRSKVAGALRRAVRIPEGRDRLARGRARGSNPNPTEHIAENAGCNPSTQQCRRRGRPRWNSSSTLYALPTVLIARLGKHQGSAEAYAFNVQATSGTGASSILRRVELDTTHNATVEVRASSCGGEVTHCGQAPPSRAANRSRTMSQKSGNTDAEDVDP